MAVERAPPPGLGSILFERKTVIENTRFPDLTPLEVQVSGGWPSKPEREIGKIFGCARWGVSGAL